ncbi:unnamed protein product [Trifolium pratense]|uniref:Uncharacterized protein n=1 Tax=Trifolium pratense TaxID=57577 RepID=A0ACB0M8Y8_TRIPR|nr:unnamed protein product [Trifolium pratense]
MDDFFDDIDTIVPTTRAKTGSRFAPKAKPKPKQSIQKNVSASSENAVSSKDGNNVLVDSSTTLKESEGISQNESHIVVAVSSSIEEPIRSDHNPDVNNVTAKPVQPANAVESVLNSVAAPSTNCPTIGKNKELSVNGEGSFLDINKSLEVSLNEGPFLDSNIHSNFESGELPQVLCSEFEFDPFSNVLPDPGTRNAKKFQPKIKPRPRVSNTPATASASSGMPFSEDNTSLETVIPSHPDSLNAMTSETIVHDGTRDLPSSFGKSAAETADIFSGLESLDDILNQAATGTGKPDLKSFNGKGAEEDFVLPGYSRTETQEGTDLNADCPIDNVYDYQSMKSGTDPTSEIPRHEVLTNSADSPTLADLMQQDGTGEKEDANKRKKSGKKNKRSSIAGVEDKGGKTSRKPRKQSVRKPAKNSLNEPIEDNDDVLDPPYEFDGDELEENDDENEVDNSSKKKRASTSSKKKSVAKNGKTSGKRKKANDDLDKVTEKPPKKFPHSSRRKKRCVDKALLDDEYLDQRTLPLRDIILLAEHKERLAKKEGTTTNTSSANQSDGDFLHETDVNNEDEFYGSDDGYRDPYDGYKDPYDGQYQASENITSTAPLLNYQSFMEKTPRGKWSTGDTEKFYEAIRQFGTDFTMIQQLFPDKTRHQIKLKYKKEERQHPLLLSDAVNNPTKDLSLFKLVIERQIQKSKEEQDAAGDASDLMPGEEVEEPTTPGTNEEVAKPQQEQDHINVKDQEDSMPVPGQSDDDDDDDDDGEDPLLKWSQYQSSI